MQESYISKKQLLCELEWIKPMGCSERQIPFDGRAIPGPGTRSPAMGHQGGSMPIKS